MADPLTTITRGNALMAETPITFEPAKLSGDGIPVMAGGGVSMMDGSSGSPIQLPSLDAKTFSTVFNYMLIMTAGKVMKALQANPDPTKLYLVSRKGNMKFEERSVIKCFPPDDICECPPDWIAGWQEIDGNLCLVKLPLDQFSDVWEDSSTVDISGAGTEDSPYIATVKISADAGNLLTAEPDGLFVGP